MVKFNFLMTAVCLAGLDTVLAAGCARIACEDVKITGPGRFGNDCFSGDDVKRISRNAAGGPIEHWEGKFTVTDQGCSWQGKVKWLTGDREKFRCEIGRCSMDIVNYQLITTSTEPYSIHAHACDKQDNVTCN